MKGFEIIMQKLKLISHSSLETIHIAKILAKYLTIGNTVVLTGELGAGKTKFTEGFLSYYNLEDEISSPTFNIVNEYQTPFSTIYHFDVYRLADIDEFYAIGGEEYFDKGICLIEWGEQIEDALPLEYIKIYFEKNNLDDNCRIINIQAIGEKYQDILDQFQSECS